MMDTIKLPQHSIQLPSAPFVKCIDKSGRFYHVIQGTDHVTYDTPHGDSIPLQKPSMTSMKLQEQRQAHIEAARSQRAKERNDVINEIQSSYAKQKYSFQKEQNTKESQHQDSLWEKACARGKSSGIVSLNGRSMGYISTRIYDFKSTHHRSLTSLSLNGNALTSLERLPFECKELCELSLAYNSIECLDPHIGNLTMLTRVNLVRNGLKTLPEEIGKLVSLNLLDLSDNNIEILPKSIGMLTNMKVLRLECNRLKQLPDEIGKMNCEEINVNGNQLSTLPGSIGTMRRLRILLANDNELRFLPVEACHSTTISMLHLSRNNIRELPKSIENMTGLECLWLDFNQISTLPQGFHHLTKLKELKMDGNTLIHPPIEVIVKGAKEVVKWCRLKLAAKESAREKNIILDTLSLLEQVEKNKVTGLANGRVQHHASVYEPNVLYKEDYYHQFLLPAFWESFVPSMERIWSESSAEDLKGVTTSYLYERHEVERILTKYQDAGGRILRYEPKALFRRCCCIEKGASKGAGRVCVPPKIGFMCQRPAVMVRTSIVMESAMVERRRKKNEELRVKEAARAGEKIAVEYLNTEEGLEMLQESAEKELSKLGDTSHVEIEQSDVSKKSSSSRSIRFLTNSFRKSQKVEDAALVKMMHKLREEYIAKEIENRRINAIETNKKMMKIMDAWLGCKIEDVFRHWKVETKRLKCEREKAEQLREKERRRLQDEEQEKLQMVRKELSLWIKEWDDFHDRYHWIHSQTQEIILVEPTIEFLLSQSWDQTGDHTLLRSNSSLPGIDKVDIRAQDGRAEKEAFAAARNILRLRRENMERTTKEKN